MSLVERRGGAALFCLLSMLVFAGTARGQEPRQEQHATVFILDGRLINGPSSLKVGGSAANTEVKELPAGCRLIVTMVEILVHAPPANRAYGTVRLNHYVDLNAGAAPIAASSVSFANVAVAGDAVTLRWDVPGGLPLDVGGRLIPQDPQQQTIQWPNGQMRVHGYLSVPVDQMVAKAARDARATFLKALREVAPAWVASSVELIGREQIEAMIREAIQRAADQRAPREGK